MQSKFAAVLGPILMGIGSLLTGSPHLAILVVLVLFLVDDLFLYVVDEEGRSDVRGNLRANQSIRKCADEKTA